MKKPVSERTKRILLRVLDHLDQVKERLDMETWGEIYPKDRDVDSKFNPLPPCKTVACLAGTCLLVSRTGLKFLKDNNCVKQEADETNYRILFPDNTPETAARILGLTKEEEYGKLFFFKTWGGRVGWPSKFSRNYNRAKTAKGRFNATKARVMHYIETGE